MSEAWESEERDDRGRFSGGGSGGANSASALPPTLYHATNAGDAIREEGFRSGEGEGVGIPSANAHGVYVTDQPGEAERYTGFLGSKAEVLTVSAPDVHNVADFKDVQNEAFNMLGERAGPSGIVNMSSMRAAVEEVAANHGYDAIKDYGGTVTNAPSAWVILNPANVKVA